MRKPFEPRAEEKIKDFFFQHPTMKIHLRALARAVGLSAPATKQACSYLVKTSFVEERVEAPLVTYTAKHETKAFRDEKQLWNLRRLRESGLVEHLARCGASAVILFGSYAKGVDWEQSDVDLAVVGASEEPGNLAAYEEFLERNVQVFSVERLQKSVWNNLVNGVVVHGRWDPL